MEKKLRQKFIYISCSVVFFVMFLIAVIINISNFIQIDNSSNEIANLILSNNGEFPRYIEKTPRGITPETPFTTRYFSVRLDNSQNIISVNTNHIHMQDVENAISYTKTILQKGRKSGFYHRFKYAIKPTSYGKMIVFVDYNREFAVFNSTIFSTILICLLAMAGVFILMLILSKRAVEPIVSSYIKQQQFITNITHELKTPLTIIKTNTEVIELENKSSEWTNSIHSQISRLNDIINYLVTLSKLEEGCEQNIKVDFSLSDAVLETVKPFEVLSNAQDTPIVFDVENNLSYCGDEKSIRLLISVLMDNAIKYTTEKSLIYVSLNKLNKKRLIQIKNHSHNLTAGNYDFIFERFYRLESSRNSELGGYGIGLSVAKAIVKNHGGNIKAQSPDGEHMIISVTL